MCFQVISWTTQNHQAAFLLEVTAVFQTNLAQHCVGTYFSVVAC